MFQIDNDVFEVVKCYDRESMTIAYFTKKEDALKAVGTSAYMAVHSRRLSITVFETFEEYTCWQQDQPRREALAKLTPAERKLLGLE